MKKDKNNPAWERIIKRIAERTGLTSESEIDAYSNFCECADTEDGVIMYGDVQHLFYRTLISEAPQQIKKSEIEFYDRYFNNPNRPRKTPESPLSEKARKTMEHYLDIFAEKIC